MRRPLIPVLTSLLATAATVATTATAAVPAAAQVVSGVVVDGSTARPLGATFVELVDTLGKRRATALTGEDGTFRLFAPAAGRYEVRAELIGWEDARSEVIEVADGGLVRVRLTTRARAIDLEGIAVSGEARCEVRPAAGEATARLWDEARKALSLATWAEKERMLEFRWHTWDRVLDPGTLRVLEETRERGAGYHAGSPFVSLPAEDLHDNGYVRAEEDGWVRYFGPDPSVLMSDVFLDAHCFLVRTDDPPETGWVGLAFEPVRRRDVPDIEGVLWIDAASSELRRLEYRYTHLPNGFHTDVAGGTFDFGRIPQGPWLVQEWAIRMPVVGIVPGGPAAGDRRKLAEVRERGGKVVRVRFLDGGRITEEAVVGTPGRSGAGGR